MQSRVDDLNNKLKVKSTNLINRVEQAMERNKSKLDLMSANLSKNNPIEVLNRGFSKTTKNGTPIISIKNLNVGDTTETTLKDGKILSKIIEVKEK